MAFAAFGYGHHSTSEFFSALASFTKAFADYCFYPFFGTHFFYMSYLLLAIVWEIVNGYYCF